MVCSCDEELSAKVGWSAANVAGIIPKIVSTNTGCELAKRSVRTRPGTTPCLLECGGAVGFRDCGRNTNRPNRVIF